MRSTSANVGGGFRTTGGSPLVTLRSTSMRGAAGAFSSCGDGVCGAGAVDDEGAGESIGVGKRRRSASSLRIASLVVERAALRRLSRSRCCCGHVAAWAIIREAPSIVLHRQDVVAIATVQGRRRNDCHSDIANPGSAEILRSTSSGRRMTVMYSTSSSSMGANAPMSYNS